MTITFHGVERDEALRRVGALRQLAGIESFVETEGAGAGSRRLQVSSGGGLTINLHPDRALDIGAVQYRGIQVSWLSPTGIASPALAVDRDMEWLRTFGGGLLTTCGLESFGPPSDVDGVHYPMHGRVSTVPATITRSQITDTEVVIEGEIRQARVFGENLLLRRRVTVPLGSARILVEDTVTNESWVESGHMMLYHCNLGWPLIGPEARLTLPSLAVTPRDRDAEAGMSEWFRLSDPIPGYREQVFRHDFSGSSESGMARVKVENPSQGLSLEITFDTATLPGLHQWKMMAEGHYVLGLEPTNANWNDGRAAAEAIGALPRLQAGESVSYRLEFDFEPPADIDQPSDTEAL